jgi:hypothetical protein
VWHHAGKPSLALWQSLKFSLDFFSQSLQVFKMTLSDYLAANNLTEAEFAVLVRRDPSTVWRWIRGKSQPDRPGRQAIFRVTGGAVTPNELVSEPEAAE